MEFVELDKINPMYFDKPYYLEPTKQGRHAYALLRETLTQCNRVAIARVVVRTKEYIAAVKAIEDALVLELMHWASEIVASDTLEIPDREKLPEKEMKMARMLVDTMSVEEFEPEKFTNKYHDELLAMIEARAAGKELRPRRKRRRDRRSSISWMCWRRVWRRASRAAPAQTEKRRRRSAARRPQRNRRPWPRFRPSNPSVLILRDWRDGDLEEWAAMSADVRVAEFLGGPHSRERSESAAAEIRRKLANNGYGWWVVEVRGGAPFAGVIALQEVPFEAAFTPAYEIGWRLAFEHWGKGYATEGARRRSRTLSRSCAGPRSSHLQRRRTCARGA